MSEAGSLHNVVDGWFATWTRTGARFLSVSKTLLGEGGARSSANRKLKRSNFVTQMDVSVHFRNSDSPCEYGEVVRTALLLHIMRE